MTDSAMYWWGYEAPEGKIDLLKGLGADSSYESWMNVLKDPEVHKHYFINGKHSTADFPSCRWTIPHHAAFVGAPLAVFKELARLKFPMSLPDGDGELPLGVLCSKAEGQDQIKKILTPKFKHPFNGDKLSKLESKFHDVIMSEASEYVEEFYLSLPVLSLMLEEQYSSESEKLYFNIPAMYGGFSCVLERDDQEQDIESLIVETWCRVFGGSGKRFRCTEDAWELIAEGFD